MDGSQNRPVRVLSDPRTDTWPSYGTSMVFMCGIRPSFLGLEKSTTHTTGPWVRHSILEKLVRGEKKRLSKENYLRREECKGTQAYGLKKTSTLFLDLKSTWYLVFEDVVIYLSICLYFFLSLLRLVWWISHVYEKINIPINVFNSNRAFRLKCLWFIIRFKKKSSMTKFWFYIVKSFELIFLDLKILSRLIVNSFSFGITFNVL